MRKTARPVVWEGAGAQSPSPDPIFGGIGFGRGNRLPHLGGGGGAGCLIRFQLAEAAVDGALDAGFVAGEFGEGVGTLAIDVESAGREVALVGRDGWRRRRFAVLFGVVFFGGVPVLAALFLGGHVVEAVAVDAGLHGEDTVEAALVGGDAQDQVLFAGAYGLEAVQVVVEEEKELFGILVEEDMFVGTQAVEKAITAGSGFAFGGARAGGFLGVLAVGVDLGLAGGARFIRIIHMRIGGRVRPAPCRFHTTGAGLGIRMAFCTSD